MSKNSQVDLTNCDREPIHIPGSVQPHGFLLAVDASFEKVLRASENAAEALGQTRKLQGRALETFLDPQALHEIRNAAAASGDPSKPGVLLGLAAREGAAFDVAVHRHKGVAIIEFEPTVEERRSPFEIARTLISAQSRASDLHTLLTAAPRAIRGVLGYDRVMIYQFAPDGSGKVYAEAKRHDLESFLGQHFPASDIPAQARRLYLQNTIRIISDASGAYVPIVPELDQSGEPLDLSFAHLRSVSPIHCEYLRNMGVGASMSVSIIVDGVLWGLVACHHYTPKTLTMSERMAAEMFGGFLSLQIDALSKRGKLESAARARRALDQLMRRVAYHGDIIATLREQLSGFCDLMPCDGVGLWIGGTWSAWGSTPPAKAVPALTRFLNATTEGRLWASDELAKHLPGAEEYSSDAAGAFAIPLSQIPKDYLIIFRKEVAQTVNWAGSPEKQYESGPLGDRLTPRKSFALWQEEVRGQSIPWSEDDRDMAEAVRNTLLEVMLRHSEVLETERHTAEVRQKVLNEELNHRVKNILALIKSLVAQPIEEGRDLAEYVEALKGRIMALSHAHDQVMRNDGGGTVRALFEAELSPYSKSGAVNVEGPSLGLDARAYSVLALVTHELATNAAKYGALSAENGKLKVEWRLSEDGALEIDWRESDGPTVVAPKRQGFGSILLKRSIPFDLGGESTIEYAPDGLRATLRIPERFVDTDVVERVKKSSASTSPAANGALQGRRVMLVEDQLVIAIDAEAMLLKLGAASVETASSAGDALRMLQSVEFDVCVLDVNLGSATSLPVAEELDKTSCPFIFATGYGDHTIIPRALAHVPVIRKPYDAEDLRTAIAQALGAET